MNYPKFLTKKYILISIISTLNIASLYTTETTPQLKLRSLNKKITPEQLQALKRENFLKIPKLKKQLKLTKDEVREITQKIRINKEIAILYIIKKILSEDLQNYEPSDSLDVYSTYMANKIIEKYPNIIESIKNDIKKYFLNHFAQKKIFLKIYDPRFIEFIENIIKESLEPNVTHNDEIFFMTNAYEIIKEEQDKYIEPWKIYEPKKIDVQKIYLHHNREPLNELKEHLKVIPKQTVKNNPSFSDGQQKNTLFPEIQEQKTNQPETVQDKPHKNESILPNINNKYNSNSQLMYLKPNQSVFKKNSQPVSLPSLNK